MGKSLHVLIFLFSFLSLSQIGFGQDCIVKPVYNQEKSDLVMSTFLKDFNTALQSADDAVFINNWFVSKAEFDSILNDVAIKNSNCITLEETNFDVETNSRAYRRLLEAGKEIKINEVVLQEYSHNYSCGNLMDILRVKCRLRYAENRVSDFTFLMIKIEEDIYKVIRYYGDEKLLK